MKAFAICALGIAFGIAVYAGETKVNIEELPAPVQTAMRQQTRGATILGASKEREDGRMTYEVETKLEGKGRDLTFDENGSLLEIEQEVDLESIPRGAREAIQKKAAEGTVKKVESVRQGATTSYEADVRMENGKKQEIAVNADGSPHKED